MSGPDPVDPRAREARQGALVRSGRAVEKLIGGLPADPAVMACVHLTSFSARSLVCVTGPDGALLSGGSVASCRGPSGRVFLEGVESSAGGGADGAGPFAEDVPGGGGVEAEDGAEQDGFGLVGGQGGDQGDGVAGGGGVEGAGGGVGGFAGGGPGGEVFGGDGQGGLAVGAAQVVQGAVAGDGGGPAAERVVGAGEGGRSRVIWSQVSEAMSSASCPARARR